MNVKKNILLFSSIISGVVCNTAFAYNYLNGFNNGFNEDGIVFPYELQVVYNNNITQCKKSERLKDYPDFLIANNITYASGKQQCMMPVTEELKVLQSETPVKVDFSNCKIEVGTWTLFKDPFANGAKNNYPIARTHNPDEVYTMNIVPLGHITRQVGCEEAEKYIDIFTNYTLATLESRRKYLDKYCVNKAHCETQYRVCKVMELTYGEFLNCNCFDYLNSKYVCKK